MPKVEIFLGNGNARNISPCQIIEQLRGTMVISVLHNFFAGKCPPMFCGPSWLTADTF